MGMTHTEITPTDTHTVTYTGPRGVVTRGVELRDGRQVRAMTATVTAAQANDPAAALRPLPRLYGLPI
jgi:hypothetical protein